MTIAYATSACGLGDTRLRGRAASSLCNIVLSDPCDFREIGWNRRYCLGIRCAGVRHLHNTGVDLITGRRLETPGKFVAKEAIKRVFRKTNQACLEIGALDCD